MLIENYKGIEINHSATADEFYTNIVILKGSNGKKDQYIRNGRLQATRDMIDKFLNTAAKKPVLTKAWYKGRYDSDEYEKVEVILKNEISGDVQINNGRKILNLNKNGSRSEQGTLYLSCKENDAIIALLKKKDAEINKLEKEVRCTSGKLIPFVAGHFN